MIQPFIISLLLVFSLPLTAGEGLPLEKDFTTAEVTAPFLFELESTTDLLTHPSHTPDRWKPVDRINYGRNPHGWARFTVTSKTGRTVYMELTSHFIDSVDVWMATGPDTVAIRGPIHYRHQVTPLSPVSHRYFLYALSLPQKKPVTVWVRGRVLPGDVLKFGVILWTPAAFLDAWQAHTWGWALFTGIILAILGGVLTSYLLAPQRIYLYYAGYISAMCIYMLLNDGWGGYLYGYLRKVDRLSSISLALNLALFFFVLFCRSFLECKPLKYQPEVLLLTINTLIIVAAELSVHLGASSLTSALFFLGGVGVAAYSIPWAVYIAEARKRRFTMLPVLLVAVGVMVTFLLSNYFLVNTGLISSPLPDMLMARVALLIELLILSIAWLRQRQQLKREQAALLIQNRQLQTDILHTQNTERHRIGQDLHDDLGGLIAALSSRISAAMYKSASDKSGQELQIALKISEKIADRTRRISHHLMPPEFEKTGLTECLRELVDAMEKPKFSFSVFGGETRMSPEREAHIYRLASELVVNIRKHAGASTGRMQLFFHPDFVSIMIDDNGKNPAKTIPGQKGIGLQSIQIRTDNLNARIIADSTPEGNSLILEIPYE